ncbi:hypothetical protein PUN28_005940 [Cardiocondyla obscurior]|uniref:Secreted protein n=1 Tax=Cardiocondyla obscurior TaxID=286306 RepID=A0AAW2G6A8_9HYME
MKTIAYAGNNIMFLCCTIIKIMCAIIELRKHYAFRNFATFYLNTYYLQLLECSETSRKAMCANPFDLSIKIAALSKLRFPECRSGRSFFFFFHVNFTARRKEA